MPSAARKIAPPQIEAPNAQTPPDGLFKASQEAAPEKLMVARPFMPVAAAITPYLGRIDGSGWYSDFGPLLMVGFGGVFAEVLKDVVFAPLPVNDAAATDMIQRLKGIEILRGVRGQPPADIQALAKLLVNVSCLVEDNPGIGQLDLNPVFVYAQGDGLCVVDSLLVPCETHPLMAVTHEK